MDRLPLPPWHVMFVGGCKRSSLQAVIDLAPSVQAQVAQHHSQLPTDAELCSLFMGYCQPCPFFAAKPAATIVMVATSFTSSMVAAVSSAAVATGAATSSCTVLAGSGATAMTSAIATITATTTTSVTATTSGAVKKSKLDVPQQKGGHKKVSKWITADQWVEKSGKYGL